MLTFKFKQGFYYFLKICRKHLKYCYSCNINSFSINWQWLKIYLLIKFQLTVDVMFKKWVARVECWNCKPTTAAGALCPFDSIKTACVAVTNVFGDAPTSNGTENTKLFGSILCWSTALLYQTSSIALRLYSLKCLQQSIGQLFKELD